MHYHNRKHLINIFSKPSLNIRGSLCTASIAQGLKESISAETYLAIVNSLVSVPSPLYTRGQNHGSIRALDTPGKHIRDGAPVKSTKYQNFISNVAASIPRVPP